MPPELPVAVFVSQRLARVPLLLGNAREMAVALLIEATVGDKHGFDDRRPLPDGDQRQILDVEVNRHRHKVGRELALGDLLGPDLFGLRNVQFSCVFAYDQLRTVLFPPRLGAPLLPRSGCT